MSSGKGGHKVLGPDGLQAGGADPVKTLATGAAVSGMPFHKSAGAKFSPP